MPPMQGSSEITEPYARGVPYDFSLMLGGAFFQLFRKSYLSGDILQLVRWRVLALCMIAWLPLLCLAIVTGGRTGLIEFEHDVEVHVRLLIALPILIAGELFVQPRIRSTVSSFVQRRLILLDDLPHFDQALQEAMRWRNSVVVQFALLILVYTVGLWHWGNRIPTMIPTWYAMPGGRWHLTPAGYWYVFVSIPIAQFVLVCWYWRFFVWCEFLWRVSRLKLKLISTHPDHRAGLGFLGRSAYAFTPILFAQGAMLAGVVASRILYRGEALTSFRLQILGFVLFFILAALGPLLMFTPQMALAKRKGLAIYGRLGQNYVEDFERKWIDEGPQPAGDLLGTADIQTLADLANSYSVVSDMRTFPFGLQDITRLAVTTAAPFAPLLLTVYDPEELVMRLIKLIF